MARPEGKRLHCKLRLRRHKWIKGIDIGVHRYKVCSDCGRQVLTHHVSCSIQCALGPGLYVPPRPASKADIDELKELIKSQGNVVVKSDDSWKRAMGPFPS